MDGSRIALSHAVPLIVLEVKRTSSISLSSRYAKTSLPYSLDSIMIFFVREVAPGLFQAAVLAPGEGETDRIAILRGLVWPPAAIRGIDARE